MHIVVVLFAIITVNSVMINGSAPPLEPIEYYEVMVFLIIEQYDSKSLDSQGALDVGAILRAYEQNEDYYLQSLRRRYAIDHESFMMLDRIARDCMGEATGTGKNKKGRYHEKEQPAMVASASAPAPASAPAAAPAAAGKSLMIRSVQAEASSAEVQARSDDSRLGVYQHHLDADVEAARPRPRRTTRTNDSDEDDGRTTLALKLWACCCCFLILVMTFFLLEPLSITSVRGGFYVRSN